MDFAPPDGPAEEDIEAARKRWEVVDSRRGAEEAES